RVWLHVTGRIYQTLPVYDGLQTTGVYVYPTNISVPDKTTDIAVQSQVHNASTDPASVTLAVVVVDSKSLIRARFGSEPRDLVAGEKSVIEATGSLKDARFWTIDEPYLYDVYTLLSVDGRVVDVNRVTTGFRKTDFKGGAGSGGIHINDQFVY